MSFRKFKDIEYPVPGVDTAIQVLTKIKIYIIIKYFFIMFYKMVFVLTMRGITKYLKNLL